MDSQPSSKALHSMCASCSLLGVIVPPRLTKSRTDRINTNISQLLQRFENIMATATVCSCRRIVNSLRAAQLMHPGREHEQYRDSRGDVPARCGIHCFGISLRLTVDIEYLY